MRIDHFHTGGDLNANEKGLITFNVERCMLRVFRSLRVLRDALVLAVVLFFAVFYLERACRKREE